jgi:hypothetical protein
MRVRDGGGRTLSAIAVLAWVALVAPTGATAATVVNGDFESGSLQGWHVHRAMEAGNWFAYKGVNTPTSPWSPAPTTGSACSPITNPSTRAPSCAPSSRRRKAVPQASVPPGQKLPSSRLRVGKAKTDPGSPSSGGV